jgi:hypothetical protein
MHDTTERAHTIAVAARRHLTSAGWMQGCFYDASKVVGLPVDTNLAAFEDCPMCLMGAINLAATGNPITIGAAAHEDKLAIAELRVALGRAMSRQFNVSWPPGLSPESDPGMFHVIDFNDHLLTTLDDVVAVLDDAIAQLQAQVAA